MTVRRELESELATARQLATDPADPRVRDAETALASGDPLSRLAATMRALLRHRRPESTICPSDAARAVGGDSWRDLMDAAREVAADLARQGVITVRQHGADVDIAGAAGPIRLARGPRWPETS